MVGRKSTLTEEERKARQRAADKRSYEKHKEERKAKSRKWSAENPEKKKAINKRTREKGVDDWNEYQRVWRANNPDKVKEIDTRYRENNPEKVKEKDKRFSQTEKGRVNIARKHHARRARDKNAPNTLTATQWNAIKAQQGNRCAECGKPFTASNPATKDHIVPSSMGGGLTRGNVRATCRSCNSRKGNRHDFGFGLLSL